MSCGRPQRQASPRSFGSRPRSCCTKCRRSISSPRDARPTRSWRWTALQARLPRPIGRPFPVKGADELYAELLLEAGRPQAAVEWFDKTLRRTPNRSRAVLGLARARAKFGDAAGSRQAYEQFLQNWRNADPGLPELKEARTAIGR